MNAQQTKEFIIENEKLEDILNEIGCTSVKYHSSGYYTAGNKDGDNKQAITIYVPSLNVVNYTRSLKQPSDLITLIEFNLDLNFFHALKWLHEFLGLDFYSEHEPDLPLSLILTREMQALKQGIREDEDKTPVKPIDEKILNYYHPYVNDYFYRDGISYATQREFEIGYDDFSNRITIPIRDETGKLCGVKGRLFKDHLEEGELKYVYIEPCPRSKILYGLYKTYDYIKESNKIWVGEAEKFTMQLWSYGYKNCVSLGGLANRKLTKIQVEKLTRLGVDIVLCLDKDIKPIELEEIAKQFIDGINVYAVIDNQNTLDEKESPSDNKEKFEFLIKNCIYKLK